ncbi:MAG: type II secretion system protein GspK [Gammaproteobacteria bacterium]|nr:type II secretion system protein GspK [Gammaproteobacteria bacterium]
MKNRKPKHLQGSVIVVTLWTIILLTILVTVIAGQIRLSAKVAFFHQEELGDWANVISAVNQSEMELMLERMPRPPETLDDLNVINRNPLFKYNGQELILNYPQTEGITVRIYDHSGKINLREIGRPRMRALLEKKLGEEADDQIDELIASWGDWVDLNDNAGIDGAETDYYENLDAPYIPRNGKIESVEEILHIRGFEEVFADIDLDAAFTLYTDDELVNLNLATVEAMRLLPGLDDELIEEILAFRQNNEFRGNGDVAQIVPAENMAELRPWMNSRRTSSFYTIMAYKKLAAGDNTFSADVEPGSDVTTTAFAEIVQISTFTDKAKILKINPYQKIPIRPAFIQEDEFLE